MVSSGQFLTWVGTFSAWSFDTLSLDDAISAVSVYLKNNYNLVVTDYNDTLDSDLGAGTVTVILQTNMDRNSADDIRSNVDDAFANAVKSYGTSLSETGSTISVNSASTAPTAATEGATYQFSVRNLLPSWLGGATVTPEQQAAYTAQNASEIKAVAANASQISGSGSSITATATATATDQAAKAAADEAALANKQNADTASRDNLFLYGAIAVGVVVLAFVAFPYIKLASGR